jgi:hypothetical protein
MVSGEQHGVLGQQVLDQQVALHTWSLWTMIRFDRDLGSSVDDGQPVDNGDR